MYVREDLSTLRVYHRFIDLRIFFPKLLSFSWIFSIFITFAERQLYSSESKTAMGGGGGALRPVLCINEPKKSDARSATKAY
jgi:hypothetical protein